jgi:branched-subunit amino acid ABC-type transport system permease component
MNQILLNILYSSSIYILLALSFSIIYYVTKIFHIAHAIIITFSAYLIYLFFQQIILFLWLAIPIAILFSIILGILLELFIYKPLRRKNTSPLLMLITSLGLYVVLQNCISLIWGDSSKRIRIGEIKIGNEIFGAYITNIQIITIVVSIILFLLSILFLKYNKIGRNIRAVASNSELANIVGINSDKVILWSFGIGSGMASIAGILVASDTGLTPTMGFNLLLYGIVAMIIGGVGSTWGLVGGALLLATAQHLTAFYIDSKWMDAITYIILILFLIWKPLGFSGKRLKKIEL